MKIDDVKALWAIRRHAADAAAQQLVRADAQRADADRALADFRARMEDEAQRAQGLGLSQSLALWYRAAARRLHDLQTVSVERADQAVSARDVLRAAMTEAERIGTVSEQLERQRRTRVARHAQGEMDEAGLRRRAGRLR
jgi:nucleotidyltransferase/DNA polymerase involved in DNA repair